MQYIKEGIYLENSFLGVTLGALVFPHGTIMIDAPLRAEDARFWRSMLVNQRGGPSRMLISLDSHPDRTLGTRALECMIVAHKETARVFRNRPTIFKGQNMESGAIWETYGEAIGMRWTSPDITFSRRMSLHWGQKEVILEHQPGPTPGSIWVIIPDDQVIFVGDTIIPGQPPFIANANLDIWLENLDYLLITYKDYKVISGRSGIVTADDIRTQIRFLKKVVKGMERLTRRNAPPEESESLAPRLLSHYKPAREHREKYMQRLQYGLYQCYAHYYHSVSDSGSGDGEGLAH